ncbi:MAG: winged helix-turn-helix transcriptional regulator [Chitinophagaceae bacterium]|nr:winged helix-turn-helix transcriptional regulator [Chitinophagaceae bacterium]
MKKKNIDVFAAIADPNRRKILLLLTAGSLTMNSLAGHFRISRPAISKHVKILEENRLVSIYEMGRERFCELEGEGFKEVVDWIKFYENFWNEKLDNLDRLLKNKKKKK